MPSPLQVTALAWLFVSAGHTLNGRDWQSNAKFRALPDEVKACAKIGWYQGSGFFAVSALLNYIWSKNPVLLHQAEHKALAASIVAIFWISSYHYAKKGVTANAVVTALGGALQAYAAGNR